LPGFNDVYEGTVEWRIEKDAKGKARPFATILRWNAVTPDDRDKATGPIKSTGRVLVVTRLGPGGVCHVGYVDAKANPDANELARKLADEHARAFRCGKDKRIISGKSDDHRVPAGEHTARGVRDSRATGAGSLATGSVLPAERHLIEALGAEALRGARDRAAAERLVEADRRLIVGQRPDHQAFEPALRKIAPRRRKQPSPEAKPLEFRAEIKLVDLAIVEQTARAIAPVVRVTRDAIAELQQRNAASLGDGVLPPARTAPADQLFQFGAGDDAAIGRPPCRIVRRGDQRGIGWLGAANLDEDGRHVRIEQRERSSCKPPVNRWLTI